MGAGVSSHLSGHHHHNRSLRTDTCHQQQVGTTLRPTAACKLHRADTAGGGWQTSGNNQEPSGSSPQEHSTAGEPWARPYPEHLGTVWIGPSYMTSTYAAAGNFMWKKTSLDRSL